ncbi:hypothetical protein IJG72_08775 [bacterium]|nr:hypothetical protein [bacterium]
MAFVQSIGFTGKQRTASIKPSLNNKNNDNAYAACSSYPCQQLSEDKFSPSKKNVHSMKDCTKALDNIKNADTNVMSSKLIEISGYVENNLNNSEDGKKKLEKFYNGAKKYCIGIINCLKNDYKDGSKTKELLNSIDTEKINGEKVFKPMVKLLGITSNKNNSKAEIENSVVAFVKEIS